jgi:hypothetical protein
MGKTGVDCVASWYEIMTVAYQIVFLLIVGWKKRCCRTRITLFSWSCRIIEELLKLRNKRCFKEIVTIHWFLICRIFQHRFLILDATCYIPESSIGICYKLNADEAGPAGNGKWGLSAVVIDTEGTVLAASCQADTQGFRFCRRYSNVAGIGIFQKLRIRGININDQNNITGC